MKLSRNNVPVLCKDTNAQENVGKQIQQIAIKSTMGVGEVIEHTWKICNMFTMDRRAVLAGLITAPTEKEKRKSRFPFEAEKRSDGRPPDTTDQLLPRKKWETTKILWE